MWARAISDSFTKQVTTSAASQARAPRALSLRMRLILLVAGTMAPLALLSGLILLQNYEAGRQAAGERVLQLARGALAAVDRELQNTIAELEVLSLSPALGQGDLEGFRNEAERFAARHAPGIVSVSDRNGQMLMLTNAPKGEPPTVRAEREAFDEVISTGKPSISNLFIGNVARRPIFTIEVPVMRDGAVAYSLAFSPPRQTYYDIVNQLRLPEGWVASVFDRNIHYVARKPALSDTQIIRPAPSPEALLGASDEAIVETTSIEGAQMLTAIVRSPYSHWMVALGLPRENLSSPFRRVFFVTMAIAAVLGLIGFAFASRLATQLLRSESDRELLINELNHRVKNTLTAVQAIVSRTLRLTVAGDNPRGAIEGRLMALSHAHNILSGRSWESAIIGEIISAVLEPYADGRAFVRGPQLRLSPRAAIPFAMVINELATNAAKYGALAAPEGAVSLLWTVTGEQLRMEWRESGGKPVTEPTRTGYGTDFIQRAVTHELGGTVKVQYLPDGLSCTIEFPVV